MKICCFSRTTLVERAQRGSINYEMSMLSFREPSMPLRWCATSLKRPRTLGRRGRQRTVPLLEVMASHNAGRTNCMSAGKGQESKHHFVCFSPPRRNPLNELLRPGESERQPCVLVLSADVLHASSIISVKWFLHSEYSTSIEPYDKKSKTFPLMDWLTLFVAVFE